MGTQSEWSKPVADRELYPGSLIGYRRFYPEIEASRDEADMATGCLTPIVHDTNCTVYKDNSWHEAACRVRKPHAPGKEVRWSKLAHPAAEVPQGACTCGFYLNYQPEATFYTGIVNLYSLRAVVEAAGHMVLGTKGYRAQRMRILGLELLDPSLPGVVPNLAEALAQNFKTVEYGKWDDLVAEFPTSDYESLLGRPLVPVGPPATCVCGSVLHGTDRYTSACPFDNSLKAISGGYSQYLSCGFCGLQHSSWQCAQTLQNPLQPLSPTTPTVTYNNVGFSGQILQGGSSPAWVPSKQDPRVFRIPVGLLLDWRYESPSGALSSDYRYLFQLADQVTISLELNAGVTVQTHLNQETELFFPIKNVDWLRCGCDDVSIRTNQHRWGCITRIYLGT